MKSTESIHRFVRDDFFANHPLQWLYVVVIVLNASMWVLCVMFFPPSNDLIMLYYNVFLGVDVDRIGSWKIPYVIPGVTLFFILVESIFAWYFFHKQERLIAHLLIFSAIILQVAGLIAMVALVLVNK